MHYNSSDKEVNVIQKKLNHSQIVMAVSIFQLNHN
jgi:hypothetical protein